MIIAKVVGNVVATQKDEKLEGRKLLVIDTIDIKTFKPTGKYEVAIDSVGAGVGEIVMVAKGSSARQTSITKNTPTDAVIMAIIDTVELEGKVIFSKSNR